MNCPTCRKAPLIVLEHDSIEVDYCTECRGLWLDAGELELLLGPAPARVALDPGGPTKGATRGERPRRCPTCRRKMTKRSTDSSVVVDRCPMGHGIWFDRGELEAVITGGRSVAGDDRIAKHVRALFSTPKLAE